MRVAVIEDNKQDFENVKSLINNFSQTVGEPIKISAFESGEEFLKSFKQGTYDVIICDIYLKTISGIKTAEEIRKTDSSCFIVFLTVSNNFAEESYDLGAFGYLVKPVSQEKFTALLKRISSKVWHKKPLLYVTSKDKPFPKLAIPFGDIMYIDVINRNVYIHLKNKAVKICESVAFCSERLLSDSRFSNCCKGTIVNFDYVKEIYENDFVMTDDSVVPIKKRHGRTVKDAYLNYSLNGILKEKL